MPSIFSSFQHRLALHSHALHNPPLILHSRLPLSSTNSKAPIPSRHGARPQQEPSTSLIAALAEINARRLRWAMRLKDVDWYDCRSPAAGDEGAESGAVLGRIAGMQSRRGLASQPGGVETIPKSGLGLTTTALQIGRDVYFGIGPAIRAIERRTQGPSLFPGPGSGTTIPSQETYATQERYGEGITEALRRWADNSLFAAIQPLFGSSHTNSSHKHHALHAHLSTIDSLLTQPLHLAAAAHPTLFDPPSFSGEEDGARHWHGLLPSTPYPHILDLHLASSVLAARSLPSFRPHFTSHHAPTSAWLDRVLAYVEHRDEVGVEISTKDVWDVVKVPYTTGEVGGGAGNVSAGEKIVEVELATGETFRGAVVNTTPQDVTLSSRVNVDGDAVAVCSVTLAREDVVVVRGASDQGGVATDGVAAGKDASATKGGFRYID
ncbi:uncharacterized protein EV422DRAFT_546567 [Fimicolochytrium jonesii]|uniref:uncharacterized protein n=1 Tax=Fimicolochytrium jonesii TaxID=1396493 RepID=UPI0022FEAA2B|nr:uncharacterized protein EV422DRAFT_546567 [Fimicolochytrium jonesii]KAI8816219.1 hypothetical protein EV422DRAFT_546567 [Fimicolochytrium jonesii]